MSNGNFVWYEYMAKDVAGAIAFYGEAVGWKVQEWGEGDDPYRMLMVGEEAVGGVMELPAEAAAMGAPPHWISYVSTDDVDATAKKAVELGGKVFKEPFDVPSVGRIAIMQDPQGAVFAGFKAEGDEPQQPSGEKPGAFSWAELMTSDWEAGFEFYSQLFGWTKGESMDMGEMGTYQMFEASGKGVGGMMNRPPEMPMSSWLYYVTTDDLDAATTRVEGNGGKKLNGPMEVPGGGRVAQYVDAQGGAFALYEGAQG